LEQRRGELPDGEPQHERTDEPQHEQRLPPGPEFRWLLIVMDFTRLSFQTEQIVFLSGLAKAAPAKSQPKAARCW